jgi:autotransporter-associated beta strand protein
LNGGTIAALDAGNFSNGSTLNYILDGDVTTVANAAPSTIGANSILLRKATSEGGPSAPVTFNVARGTATTDLVVSSIVKDQAAGLIKSGSGILALTNSNQYTGPTVINAGTILLSDSNALGTGLLTINNGGVLSLGAAMINGFDGFVNNGTASVDPEQVLTLTQNTDSQGGSSFSPTGVSVTNGFTTSFVYTVGGNRAADGITFTVQNSSPNALGGGGGQLGYQGIPNSAAVEFNIYTGQNPPQPVGTNYAVGTTGQYISSAPVNLASGNPIAITLTYDPTAQTMSETLLDLVTKATYSNVFTSVDLQSALGGSTGFVGFTGATGGAFALQTVNNFSFNNREQGVSVPNNITVPAGASVGLDVQPVALGGAGSATLQGTLTLGNSATLNVTGGASPTNAPYSLSVTGATAISGNTTINVADNGTGKGRISLGAIADQAAGATLTKTGTGTLAILGAATYTGATNVNAGTLVLNGSLGGATAVNNGGTLAGTGTTLAVSVQSGGTVAPGNGVGTLTTGAISFLNGSALALEIANTADQLKVTGAATLTGVINLAINLFTDPADNTVFTVLDGSAPLIGYATGARLSYQGNALDENEQFTVFGLNVSQIFTISYTADGGNDITLVAIPEPSTAMLLVGSVGAMLGLKRKRR